MAGFRFNLEGGEGGARYERGQQDFTPVGYPNISREAVGRMDPMGALAAYLGIKNALANSHSPGAGPEYQQAQETAAEPVRDLLAKLTGRGTGLSDERRSAGRGTRSSGPSRTSSGIFDFGKQQVQEQDEMEQRQMAKEMARDSLKNSRIQNALVAESMRADNRGKGLKNSARKTLLDSGFINALLRQLNGR